MTRRPELPAACGLCLAIGSAAACSQVLGIHDIVGPIDASVMDSPAPVDAPAPMDVRMDSATPGFPFQPSNVTIGDIQAGTAAARDEDVAGKCSIVTGPSNPQQDCFTSGIKPVRQPDMSTVNLIVVKSLKIETSGLIRATGTVPLVIVSLADMTLSGSIDAHSALLSVGPGGAPGAQSNMMGLGPGGGTAGSGSATIGGGGGSYCSLGARGGGGVPTPITSVYGDVTIRPLIGGSSGGGGEVGSGAGGGAVQLVAAGTLMMNSASYVTVGGQGGPICGAASNQNAGGGGSGGAILLEATTVSMGGVLAANGGGGGGDYSGSGGADATPDSTPAPGGAAGPSGAAGGDGFAGTTLATAGSVMLGLNSGGGGGGGGRIRINTATGTANVSGTTSPPQQHPCATLGSVLAFDAGP